MSLFFIVPTALLFIVFIFLVFVYNSLVTKRLRVKEAWSDIDVQLKRRSSLIPNLVESVKGYMKHEKELLTKVTELRSAVDSATSREQKGKLSSELSSAVGKLNIAVESYPDLKANQNVMQLQTELTDTEDKISYSRRFYNTNVLGYNSALQTFPTVLIAGSLGFKAEEFFEATDEEKKEVKVDLG